MAMQVNVVRKATLTPMVVLDPGSFDPAEYVINPDQNVIDNVPRRWWKVDGDILREMTQAEKDEATLTILPQAKRAKAARIVARTPAVMAAAGFPYNGKQFRMDAAGVAWYHLLFAARAQLTYPVVLPTKDSDGFESIASATEMQAFGAALVAELNRRLAEELALLQQVRIATTPEQVEAVVDPR